MFTLNSGSIACLVAELNAALCLVTRAKKTKYSIFLEFSFNIDTPKAFLTNIKRNLIFYLTYLILYQKISGQTKRGEGIQLSPDLKWR